jgi:hypothetical protein
MNINATLILQVINFFIAYLLFRYILLKPAYAAIEQERENIVSFEQIIKDDRQEVESLRRKLAQGWHESALFFQKNMPAELDLHLFFKGMVPKIHLPPIELSTIAEAKKRIEHAIVTTLEVRNGRRR